MNTVFKSLTIAALMGAVSAPAFADAHMSASMSCAEFKALSSEDMMTVATMAIAEVSSGADGQSLEGEAMAVEATGGTTTEAEATDSTAAAGSISDGEPKAVEATGGNEAASNMDSEPMTEEDLEAFITVCDQNLDAMVSEAAAGLDGSK